jgi:hypothetical protein
MELFDAAALLGVPVSEVRSVESSPAGDVIVTTDGVAYVAVSEDQPDGAGRCGLMYLAAPHERYGDSFPVYTAPGADDESDVGEAVLSKAELLARAKELGIQATGKWGEAKLAAAIAEAEAAAGQSGGQPDPNAGDGADGGTDNGLVGLSREVLEDIAYELGIEQLDQLSDDELVEAITIARGEE